MECQLEQKPYLFLWHGADSRSKGDPCSPLRSPNDSAYREAVASNSSPSNSTRSSVPLEGSGKALGSAKGEDPTGVWRRARSASRTRSQFASVSAMGFIAVVKSPASSGT